MRPRYPLLAIAVASALAVPLLLVVLRGGTSESSGKFRGSEPPPSLRLPDFALRDQSGRLVRTRDLSRKAVAVTFLDTQCREACPVIARQIGAALDALPASDRRHVAAVAVSSDPRGDTRRSVQAFLARHRAQHQLRYLVGSEAELRPVWAEFRVVSSLDSGSSDVHSAPVRIYDRTGEWVSTLHAGADLTPANLAHDLSLALRA